MVFQVCDDSLHSIRVHEQGRLIACGSQSGVITLLELSGALSVLQPNEKSNINAVCSMTVSMLVTSFADRSLNEKLDEKEYLKGEEEN